MAQKENINDLSTNYWTTKRVNELLEKIENEGIAFKDVENPFYDGDPTLKKPKLLWEYTEDEIREIEKCSKDVVYFAKHCQVMTDDGYEYIKLRDYQSSVLREYQNHRFNIFLAPRQVGKSITSAIVLVWYLLFNHDKNAMILANVGSTAEELVDKIKSIIRGLPFFLKPGMHVNNVMSMKFDNGCRILARTTTKTTGIGFTIHFLYMDEFAHINANFIESFFRSTYPTVSSSLVSRIIITSTPNGQNKFHDLYMDALAGDNDFNAVRVDWWQVPGRDEVWKKSEISNLGSEELFNQEYGNQFLSSDTLLLGSSELKRIKKNGAEYVWREIEALHDLGIPYDKFRWHPKFTLDVNVMKTNKFVFSIDLAGGHKGDYTVINIFKVIPLPKKLIEDMEDFIDESDFFGLLQIGIFRSNDIEIEDVKKILVALITKVFDIENLRILLEMNFKGDFLFDKVVANDEIPAETFVHTKHSESARVKKPGIKYTNDKIKLRYCEILRSKIRSNVVLLNDKKWTIPELFSFGMNNRGTYSSQSGHDDVAMTAVNIAGLFESGVFYDIVGELYDSLDEGYKELIDLKLNSNITDTSTTKEGGFYGAFNKLL